MSKKTKRIVEERIVERSTCFGKVKIDLLTHIKVNAEPNKLNNKTDFYLLLVMLQNQMKSGQMRKKKTQTDDNLKTEKQRKKKTQT